MKNELVHRNHDKPTFLHIFIIITSLTQNPTAVAFKRNFLMSRYFMCLKAFD